MSGRSQEEFRLACFVADTLRRFAEPDVLWYHNANGENRSAITGARLKRMGVRRGVPDYTFLWPGPFGPEVGFLELKRPGGRLSPEQQAFRAAVLTMGGRYAVADTGQQALEILKSWGILTNVRVAA